jgi:hypothetical protein
MIGTELAYVREKLKDCSPEEKAAAAKAAKTSVKTVRRIAKLRGYHASAITVGRLALHFRTREERGPR